MIIDLVTDKDINWMRYESNIAPKVGETISTLNPTKNTFEVLSVDHLVRPESFSDDMKQQLITVTVREI